MNDGHTERYQHHGQDLTEAKTKRRRTQDGAHPRVLSGREIRHPSHANKTASGLEFHASPLPSSLER